MVNTTALARKHGMTTKGVVARLESMGLQPLQRVQMPSGRTFMLWDTEQAEQALQSVSNERSDNQPIKENPDIQNQINSEDMAQIKNLLQQILDSLSKPKSNP